MCKKHKAVIFLLLFSQLLHALPRPAAVAGSFYSSNKEELSTSIKTALQNSKSFPKENINALIVPHAGYIFSGDIAAEAYATLHRKYENIFIIGSSHSMNFNAASIYSAGNYATPLGEIKVNQTIVSELIKDSKYFSFNPEAHKKEHTIEVQLPFLQTIYGDALGIVPIVIATSNLETIQEIAKRLKPYFNEKNLFIISSDLSHYPSYSDANAIDKQTIDSIKSGSPKEFVKTLAKNEDLNIAQLQTSACGWSSILTLLYLTQNAHYKYELLKYKNSGDTSFGDKKRVVGYSALRIFKQNSDFFLNDKEKKELREIARLSLYEATINNNKISIDESRISSKLKEPLGAFVTLYKNGKLRGCIGTFEADEPLYKVVMKMAVASAKFDNRFQEVIPDELKDIEIEISVLTPRKRINFLDEIVLGRHGIYIKKGSKNGTFLPQVASQMNWNVEEFVGNCAKEKAKIGFDGYKDAEIYTFEAIVF
ncbi:MAG: AmmeMemoRadiSam system protein B [Campylobacterales bacterium]|nr:AmmeMemoRadiSam system protein B [Campylobacterales bacterium]